MALIRFRTNLFSDVHLATDVLHIGLFVAINNYAIIFTFLTAILSIYQYSSTLLHAITFF